MTTDMPITLAEALAILLYFRIRDEMADVDERKIADMAWEIVRTEAKRIISEASKR